MQLVQVKVIGTNQNGKTVIEAGAVHLWIDQTHLVVQNGQTYIQPDSVCPNGSTAVAFIENQGILIPKTHIINQEEAE